MEIGSLATAMVGAKTAQLQMAVAARMMRMNAGAEGAVVQVLEAAQQNLDRLANVATGVGTQLDVAL